ncbi:FAD-dependent oxidoreductase [Halococcus saccharolyticus]|uniref:Glycerol-3-phosphate dehydrogenase n=1 Tax=Halococcus saccharolyticus DSM 5350 TaxID=1227455 RepID=M0MHV9_9EURY|nr:FAD-dependent oxidoreductase [Halococcus saccharolyticus]EMA43990.1 glycerol-3-phosphate dehydrogenase [Halococcus saccharolyticus DSM 5350]
MSVPTDVLVIGGGATGVGVARDLAMRGVDVVLAERDGLSGGTTGRSHGLLHSGARYAEADADGAAACIAENRVLREIAGDCLRDTGGYFVQLPGDDPDYFAAKRDACRDLGIEVDVRSGSAAREAIPELSPEIERVMRVPDAVAYPSRLVAATAQSARDHGAAIHTDAPVTDLHGDADTAADGATDETITAASIGGTVDDRIVADHIVNATGAWAGECAALAGIDLKMSPTRGVMVAVENEGLDTVLNRCREPADGDIVVPHENQVVLGTTSVAVDDPDEYPQPERAIERMIDECAAMVPALDGREPARTYWGVRPLYDPTAAGEGARAISRDFFLLDNEERDDTEGFTSIVGGKLTTHRRMAEAVADHVCERLGVDAACRTADNPLPGHDDPAVLDELVREFDAGSPADRDVTGA